MSPAFDLRRRLAAEALGTGLLVATVVGSGVMATKLTRDVGLALLGNTLPTGAILVVLVAVLGPVSGAHFNPAVTAVMAWRGRLPWAESLPYMAAQVVGAVLGTWAAHLMFELPVLQASVTIRTGVAQWFAEAVATFGLVLAIFGAIRSRPESVAMIVGLYITAAYWFTASTSFANPAVTVARAFTDSFAGIAPANVPAFIVAQVAGALVGTGFAGWLWTEGGQPE